MVGWFFFQCVHGRGVFFVANATFLRGSLDKKGVFGYNRRRKRSKIMEKVLLTALGVGGATLIGAAIGFIFKNLTEK